MKGNDFQRARRAATTLALGRRRSRLHFFIIRFASLPVAPVALRSRVIYQTAFAQRRSVLEIDAGGQASAEVRELFGHLWRTLRDEAPARVRSANDDLGRPWIATRPGLTLTQPTA